MRCIMCNLQLVYEGIGIIGRQNKSSTISAPPSMKFLKLKTFVTRIDFTM